MTSTTSSLAVAREFVRAVEAKDLDAVAATLAPGVRQVFLHTRRMEEVTAGTRKGLVVADVRGKDEVLAYTGALFAKFTPLVWRDHRWTTSERGIFFHGRGDMVVARTGKPYRNTYLIRFDVEDGRIVRMEEHGNVLLYVRLGLRPNRAEFRALLRAAGHLLSPRREVPGRTV